MTPLQAYVDVAAGIGTIWILHFLYYLGKTFNRILRIQWQRQLEQPYESL